MAEKKENAQNLGQFHKSKEILKEPWTDTEVISR